jgi:hypothetical protein
VFLPSRLLIVLFIVLADLWRAVPNVDRVWAVIICDAAAAGLIFFSNEIDDLTFGTTQRGYQIDSHTPPFLIAGFGWLLLLGVSALLFFGPLAHKTGMPADASG